MGGGARGEMGCSEGEGEGRGGRKGGEIGQTPQTFFRCLVFGQNPPRHFFYVWFLSRPPQDIFSMLGFRRPPLRTSALRAKIRGGKVLHFLTLF